MIKYCMFGLLFALSASVNANLIKMTATSASSGELGWIVVDDAPLTTTSGLTSSQFYDFSFVDPFSGITVDSGNVVPGNGFTYFDLVDGAWSVVGAGGSIRNIDGASLWIAGDYSVSFRYGGMRYCDVMWSTADYLTTSVSEPHTLVMLGLGLSLLAIRRRKQQI